MKRTFTLFIALFISTFIFAQSPSKMSYQAVVRDGSGNLINNSTIGLKLSILQGSINGTLVYDETLSPQTNQNGLLSAEFGGGTGFDTISFQNGPFFVKSEIDPNGGSNYTISHTSQLLSVPFALHANSASSLSGTLNELDPLYSASAAASINSTDITNWNNKLSSFTEVDPLFTSSLASGITATDTANWNNKLNGFTELDPLFGASTAAGISSTDITNWNNKLSSFTELDPVFSSSVAGGITSTDTSNWNNKIDVEVDGDITNELQTISVSGSDLTITGGNTITLPASPWIKMGDTISYDYGLVGINSGNYNARLSVEEFNQSDTTISISAYTDGGTAIEGHSISRSAKYWKNVGVTGTVETNYFSGRGIFGNVWGSNGGEAIRGEANTDDANYAVVGYALSKTGNTQTQVGGDFVARGDWDVNNGMGTGSHYGVSGVSYGNGLWSIGSSGWAQNSDTSGNNYGGYFRSLPVNNTSGYSTGAYSKAEGSTSSNVGIYGTTLGKGKKNHGGLFSALGEGHSIEDTRNAGIEAIGEGNRLNNYGVIAFAFNKTNNGNDTANVIGVYTESARSRFWNYGVLGRGFTNVNGSGNVTSVYGEIHSSMNPNPFSIGVDGTAGSRSKIAIGVGGYSWGNTSGDSINYGVYGYANNADTNYGVFATATSPAPSLTNVNYGVYAEAANGIVANHAGFFEGDVTITGDLNVSGSIAKAAGTFKIDHPTDPQNKFLIHSFVESPEMMNYYSGNIITDANGYAHVELPSYFESANKDFRYQLTCIGSFAQAIIKDKISNNHFVIQTNEPNVEVSWHVSAVRNDAYARQNRIDAVVEKNVNEKGKYLHPELYEAGDHQRTPKRVRGVPEEMIQAKKDASNKIKPKITDVKREEMPAPPNHKNEKIK